ncbi:antigen 5 like allergen Cul n 1-like [Drosophila obscura]|uniref:antigen 5 like allergen Cul n 1-like n=1 Tax=Drosophila obscura TaxID=7282 RepID=UPI001BB19F56|nr:antigen 5 like allergen Cul n 1-like [Drosophila obscura]
MKCWGSILWFAAGLLLLSALSGVCGKKMPKYCKREKKLPTTKTNYCGVESCGTLENLGCKNNMAFVQGCAGTMFNVSAAMRTFIVKQHNIYRNLVARGKLNDLPPSGRMLKMQWHEELAEIARFAAYRCSIGPIYRCFATMEFPGPGYNTVYNKFPNAQDPTKIVRAQLKVWFEQYVYANAKSILSGRAPGGQEIGHFLQMVTGLSDRVGCSIFRSTHFGFRYQVLICAYSCSRQKKVPAYKLSRLPGEHCTCGADQEYKNLCSTFERVTSCDTLKANLSHDSKLASADYVDLWGGDKAKKKGANLLSPLENIANFLQGSPNGAGADQKEKVWRQS